MQRVWIVGMVGCVVLVDGVVFLGYVVFMLLQFLRWVVMISKALAYMAGRLSLPDHGAALQQRTFHE